MSCLPETNIHRVMPGDFRIVEHELAITVLFQSTLLVG
jgi:hypothetical protein